MAAVKIGVSRQVVIPKKLHDELGLSPGVEDFRQGRSHGPFPTAKEAVRFLHAEVKKRGKKPTAS